MDSGDIINGGYNLTFDTSSSQASTLSGSISGAGGFIKTGSGEVALSGTNSFSGGTQVLAGTLVVATAGALLDGSSLMIGAGASQVFASSASQASPPASADKPQAAVTSAVVASASHSAHNAFSTADSVMDGPISRRNSAAVGEVMSSTNFTRAVAAAPSAGPAPAATRGLDLNHARAAVEIKARDIALTSSVPRNASACLWDTAFAQAVNEQANQKKDLLAAVDKLLAMMTP